MKKRIREGNDFDVAWAIERGGVPEDFSIAINTRLTMVVYGTVIEHSLFTITDNILSINVPKEVAILRGDYRLVFEYTLPDAGQPDGDLKCKTDVVAFRIVPFTADADDITTVDVASDVAIGFRGDKGIDGDDAYQIWLDLGNVGTYEDYIAWQRQPAVEAGASIAALELIIEGNESSRVTAEGERDAAETLRLSAESGRSAAEGLRDGAEVLRIAAEGVRDDNEGDRILAESDRADAEELRDGAELLRDAAEEERIAAEILREANIQDAIDAAALANTKAGLADTAAAAANTATEFADAATNAANTAAGNAQDVADTVDGRVTTVEDDLVQLAGEVSLLDAVQGAKIKDIENVLSTANLNQSAQVSVVGTSPLSLPKNAANSGMQVKLEGLTEDVGGVITHFEPTGRVRSVGKNLLTGRYIDGARIVESTGLASVSSVSSRTDYFKISANKQYILEANDNSTADNRIAFYDANKTFISGFINGVNSHLVVTSPSNAVYARVSTLTARKDTLRLSAGAIRIPYEPYRSTSLYLTAPELRSNGTVKDEIRKGANGYELVKRVVVGTFGAEKISGTFDTATGWQLTNGWSIGDGVLHGINAMNYAILISSIFTKDKIYKISCEIKNYVSGNFRHLLNGTEWSLLSPAANGVWTYYFKISGLTGSNGYLYFSGNPFNGDIDNVSVKELQTTEIPKDAIVTELSDGTILYTLATPAIIPISHDGILNSAENGTVYHEPVIADAGVYDTKMDILLTDYPIASIEEIIKYEDGIDTYLNVATAVIAGDGLSFTHPDLADGDLVLFTYAFDKESTSGNITATFYDSNVVKIDTVTGKAYRINEVVTNGVLTRTITEV